ncbi:hypothetical protein H4S14_000780 [Agrobacterium vitis]|nr:hypothetical protein [Agrobacterium vitis]MBE1437053.1 hypothetical protein [Agrobacterium vitis]
MTLGWILCIGWGHRMKYGIDSATMVDVARVFLDKENPRHEPFEDQDEAISYLCEHEYVLPIARDIAEHGLNPLELFALLRGANSTFIAAEGNRRLCAIKLLNDPDLAPANLRNEFVKAAKDWKEVTEIFAVVFKDRNEVRLWLDRIHAGHLDGRGRRQWKAEQKARNSGYTKNSLALAILDSAQRRSLISDEGREGRLSTVQRYVGNPIFRDALGLESGVDGEPTTDLSENDFSKLFRQFIKDVAEKKITTRDNAEKIKAYSHSLRSIENLDGLRVDRSSIEPQKTKASSSQLNKPVKPAHPTKIAPSDELQAALKEIPSYKLEQLYFSICSLSLSSHTPLLTIGAWSFLETLTAICGRNPATDFYSHLSGQNLESLGLGAKRETASIREAVKRIAELGNSTKHNKTSGSFNGVQLSNDFETMEKMLVALAKSAKGKTS